MYLPEAELARLGVGLEHYLFVIFDAYRRKDDNMRINH